MKKNMNQESKGKVRIVMFELEGSDETLRESIRSISTLMNKQGYRPALPAGQIPAMEELPGEFENVNEVVEEEQVNGSTPRKARTFKSPTILDLDLTSETSLAAFLKKSTPKNQNKKYLAIAYWFKEHRNLPEISVDHVHTALRSMGWNSPRDAGMPFRNMKSLNQWFGNGSKANFWAINHIGEGVVMKMLNGVNDD